MSDLVSKYAAKKYKYLDYTSQNSDYKYMTVQKRITSVGGLNAVLIKIPTWVTCTVSFLEIFKNKGYSGINLQIFPLNLVSVIYETRLVGIIFMC